MQQCSLRIERRGDVLLVVFSFQKENNNNNDNNNGGGGGGQKGSSLFALCKIDLVGAPHLPMDYYVTNVRDSSRYFAIRVVDEKDSREAVIGLGFREQEEAADYAFDGAGRLGALQGAGRRRGDRVSQYDFGG